MNKVLLLLAVVLLAVWGAPSAEEVPLSNDASMVIGNDVWQPGGRYQDGDDWLALVCTPAQCHFEPARLLVRPESWQGHYDDEPTEGQQLTFQRSNAGEGEVVAWLRKSPQRQWLLPGPVVTYASKAGGLKRPPTEGTYEISVPLTEGGEARFVPLYDREGGIFQLQLRALGQRQMLGELRPCSHELSTDYLLWAGEMDRDGKPDYLVSYVDEDGPVILYLSGAAAPEQLAGVSVAYDAPPFGGECDGMGWLEG